MALENPPIFDDNVTPPAAGQVLRVNAAGDGWEPVTVTSAQITVPVAAITDTVAPVALTAATVLTANAADQSGSYVEADVDSIATLANSLKTQLNAAIADNVALRSKLGLLITAHNTLLAELRTAGVVTP